ncbi:winged helix-turn-helix domain-containing protein [Methanobrevibacter sp.]|uniref:helix-turn-helix transcriptional regulator n=1 Tax=Methanobrevibacter sp. TaxID=66852 RepID=UPI0025FD1CEE|nr:transcriptional regulator FilR1 domain-containing protein [Methanobrevibacter sp.]MBR4448144.1 DUF1724 domain-containing protein [Methanobrevibacter sp.]
MNEYLNSYNTISDDVKFVSNSLIRLKVLKALYEKPSNMKELSINTKLGYSSISGVLHGLELKKMVYRKSNKYFLVNLLKLQVKNILEFSVTVNLLEEIFNIIEDHAIEGIPKKSVEEMYLLGESKLLESDCVDIDKTFNFIDDTLAKANSVRCILPIYHENISSRLNDLISQEKFVEIKVSGSVFDAYEKNSKVKNLSLFNGENNFLLIVTNEIMLFGLFRKNAFFDQNRLLISNSRDSLKWANNLFLYFKKKNK